MENIGKLEVLEVIDQDDGTAIITFDVDDNFKTWFKQTQGLKRFSQKRFEKVMIAALEHLVTENKSNE